MQRPSAWPAIFCHGLNEADGKTTYRTEITGSAGCSCRLMRARRELDGRRAPRCAGIDAALRIGAPAAVTSHQVGERVLIRNGFVVPPGKVLLVDDTSVDCVIASVVFNEEEFHNFGVARASPGRTEHTARLPCRARWSAGRPSASALAGRPGRCRIALLRAKPCAASRQSARSVRRSKIDARITLMLCSPGRLTSCACSSAITAAPARRKVA